MNMQLIFTLLSSIFAINVDEIKKRDELIPYLFNSKNYNKIIRPQNPNDRSGPVNLEFGLSIDSLVDVNAVKQRIVLKVWFLQQWEDPRLRWDPSKFNQIKHIYVNADRLWLPDLMIYNNADGDFALKDMVRAKIEFTGKIFWRAPINVKTYCEMNKVLKKICDLYLKSKFKVNKES